MHVSWKFAEVTNGNSFAYEEMYLATGVYQSAPSDHASLDFAAAVYERIAEMFREEPRSVVMALVTISRLKGVLDQDRSSESVKTLFDQIPPKEERDSDVEIDLGPDPDQGQGLN